MKKLFLPVTRLLVGLAGISFASFMTAQPSLAQLGTVDAGGNNSDNQNNNLNFDSGNFNMFDLIHRANLGNGSFDSNSKSQQIDDAARAFRERQNKATTVQPQGQILPTLPASATPSADSPSTLTIPGNN
ncbi:hypothetical protein [Nostoc parmelioides]|uniref:Uncharacterized protein n=1 Tax=Nostoc parmelioides FACHB-3921 TaxID=2692909 RepID=A0ABR8BA00_9NOSO|nr:hypothetical protein [Nostoc parmelioides]MBD2249757.1 hypothetical protein [Nostoc parmelioides FACHB-3921]